MVSWPWLWIWQVNPDWLGSIQYIVVSIFQKDVVLNFLDKLYFYIKYWYNIFFKKIIFNTNVSKQSKNIKTKFKAKKKLYHHKNKWGINFLSLQHCACSKNYKNFFKNIFFYWFFFRYFPLYCIWLGLVKTLS
jgi:hypothetical protein